MKTESITWHELPADGMPDAEITVLAEITQPGGGTEVAGFLERRALGGRRQRLAHRRWGGGGPGGSAGGYICRRVIRLALWLLGHRSEHTDQFIWND